jgi:hypothetical protein
MGQKIIEAIIEDGRLKQVEGELPAGRIKVHLVYELEEPPIGNELAQILAETSGIYRRMDAEKESRSLRKDWERKLGK